MLKIDMGDVSCGWCEKWFPNNSENYGHTIWSENGWWACNECIDVNHLEVNDNIFVGASQDIYGGSMTVLSCAKHGGVISPKDGFCPKCRDRREDYLEGLSRYLG